MEEAKIFFNMDSLFLTGICTLLLFSACSYSISGAKKTADEESNLTYKAIFESLKVKNRFTDMLSGKGLTKIDPVICRRDSIVLNGKTYFKDAMRSDLLKSPFPAKVYHLVIPDSLLSKYRYTGDDMDYEREYSIIHQFSPLLPTMKPDIYLMEHYLWACSCMEDICGRLVVRNFLMFRIENGIVTYLDEIPVKNQTDFKGFGHFMKIKMDEALPGEKITKYGIY